MTPRDILTAALARTDPVDRAQFVAHACGDDHDLRSSIEVSLDAVITRTIEPTALRGGIDPAAPGVGATIGPYTLKSVLGAGGMGIVYLADQEEPFRRAVALKIVKPGMDTPQVIARFEAERQALASMDHPNIAKVLDAGATSAGCPYFAMELVQGLPITNYCDLHRLNVRERLQLFVPVCQAVQHAHQKGIIHRDIKPSNILVAVYDGKPVPKVIDFGIAKAIQPSRADDMLTQAGVIVGTFAYMSPEQAQSGGLDLDTRADIYSLGAVLYELLTATTPLEADSIAKGSYLEMLRAIQGVEPQAPSARVTRRRDTLHTVAAHRSTDSTKLPKAIQGDLDWIALKALDKDRKRRYASANGLARDVERYLNGDPVEASPPSAAYRFRKFAYKRRFLLATGAAFAVLLISATAVSMREARRANRERDRAVQALREAESEKFAGYASASLKEDPERSIALGTYAVQATRQYGQDVPPAAVSVLHSAILASHVRLTLNSHEDEVRSVAFSPDGRTIASGSDDKTARIWDAGTGKNVFTLRHPDWVWSVAFSPDGKRLATGCTDRIVRVWDFSSYREVLTLKGHDHSITSVAFSPDGRRLASGSVDRTVILWDAATGQKLRVVRGHRKIVVAAVFSPDSKRLATASADGTARVWDVRTGVELLVLRDENAFNDVVYSPDGKRLATAGNQEAKLWDASDGRRLATLSSPHRQISKVAFTSDGTRLATTARDGTVTLWETKTARELMTLPGHRGAVDAAAFSPDGERLATGGSDHLIRLWDTGIDSEVSVLRRGVSTVNDDGTRALRLNTEQRAELWDVGEGKRISDFPILLVRLSRFDLSRNGERLAVSNADTTTRIWETNSGKELAIVRHGAEIESVAFSPTGERLATAGADGTVKVWDVAQGTNLLTLSGHQKLVSSVTFSSDAKRLATTSDDGTIRLWDAENGRETLTIAGVRSPRLVLLTPDSRTIAIPAGLAVRLWDAATGRELPPVRGHESAVSAIAFNPEGSRMATSDTEGTVIVWNRSPVRELFRIRGSRRGVFKLAFSGDGKLLTSVDPEGGARVYAADPALLLALAKRRLTRSLTKAECRTYFQADACPLLP